MSSASRAKVFADGVGSSTLARPLRDPYNPPREAPRAAPNDPSRPRPRNPTALCDRCRCAVRWRSLLTSSAFFAAAALCCDTRCACAGSSITPPVPRLSATGVWEGNRWLDAGFTCDSITTGGSRALGSIPSAPRSPPEDPGGGDMPGPAAWPAWLGSRCATAVNVAIMEPPDGVANEGVPSPRCRGRGRL